MLTKPQTLTQFAVATRVGTDVYRYWDSIQYLLAQHQPASLAARWLEQGETVSQGTEDIPAARVLQPMEVAQLNAVLKDIAPEDLDPYYEAEALDQAKVYPRCWVQWEETFDPLGQILEHYFFLQEFVGQRTAAGDAMLLYFEFLDDGSDD